MTTERDLSRRGIVAAMAAGATLAPILGPGEAMAAGKPRSSRYGSIIDAAEHGVSPDLTKDQTAALQRAVDLAAERSAPLHLPAGRYLVNGVRLRPGSRLHGAGPATVLAGTDTGPILAATATDALHLSDLCIDGAFVPLGSGNHPGLLALDRCAGFSIERMTIKRSAANGISLVACSGRITHTSVAEARDAAIFSLDADPATGALAISQCRISDCADNGILIWRTASGHDGSRVLDTTIERIGNRSGGSGQYGNGVNVFRAGSVSVSNCFIAHCSYSAIRGNAASNILMSANQIAHISEVALYAEFGFEGALIANNVIEHAATGIAVTNFNEGGRLAVVQGNLVRNLFRREHEPVDKRGDGIAVEADAVVSGNVIEGAPTAGILIGWGPYMRNVAATGNLVREAGIGIAVSTVSGVGRCLLANNMIVSARHGAIRAMDHDKPVSADLTRVPSHAGITLQGNVTT